MANVKTKDMGLVKEIQKVLLDDTDFLRILVQENLQKILKAEFENQIQTAPYERTAHRLGYRNGHYSRKLKTRVGTLELDVIRDRDGLFRTDLFKRYQRSEQAFCTYNGRDVYPGRIHTACKEDYGNTLWHQYFKQYSKQFGKRN